MKFYNTEIVPYQVFYLILSHKGEEKKIGPYSYGVTALTVLIGFFLTIYSFSHLLHSALKVWHNTVNTFIFIGQRHFLSLSCIKQENSSKVTFIFVDFV